MGQIFISLQPNEQYVSIAIHGGAGTILRGSMTPALQTQCESGLQKALDAGYKILEAGGSSLDAVEVAVTRRNWHLQELKTDDFSLIKKVHFRLDSGEHSFKGFKTDYYCHFRSGLYRLKRPLLTEK